MKPLILQFKEKPIRENDFTRTILEYSNNQNLSVLKGTNKPAVIQAKLETQTVTRTSGEDSDSDYSRGRNLRFKLETSTATFVNTEDSDSDSELTSKLRVLMETNTITESVEDTDSDPIR